MTLILAVAPLHHNLDVKAMKQAIIKSAIVLTSSCIVVACNPTNRLIIKSKEDMFTTEQIKEKLSLVRSGADFPALAKNLKSIGVIYYETQIHDGSSVFHGKNNYELPVGANYEPITIADTVNLEQLKIDIANHQQGKSDYFEISRQSANNGIGKWAVSLIDMTCTYIDKAGNKAWVENIPDGSTPKQPFTVEQIKAAHSKVKSGADFPSYIQDIQKLGVISYETSVVDGHTDYFGVDNFKTTSAAKHDALTIAETSNKEQFKAGLKAHQQGKTDYPTFIRMCAAFGIEKWVVSIEKMTCTYFDKAGQEILIEEIPN